VHDPKQVDHKQVGLADLQGQQQDRKQLQQDNDSEQDNKNQLHEQKQGQVQQEARQDWGVGHEQKQELEWKCEPVEWHLKQEQEQQVKQDHQSDFCFEEVQSQELAHHNDQDLLHGPPNRMIFDDATTSMMQHGKGGSRDPEHHCEQHQPWHLQPMEAEDLCNETSEHAKTQMIQGDDPESPQPKVCNEEPTEESSNLLTSNIAEQRKDELLRLANDMQAILESGSRPSAAHGHAITLDVVHQMDTHGGSHDVDEEEVGAHAASKDKDTDVNKEEVGALAPSKDNDTDWKAEETEAQSMCSETLDVPALVPGHSSGELASSCNAVLVEEVPRPHDKVSAKTPQSTHWQMMKTLVCTALGIYCVVLSLGEVAWHLGPEPESFQ